MFKWVIVYCACLFFFDAKAQTYCDEEVDNQAIINAVVPFGIFMAYHLIPSRFDLPILGMRTNMKTHAAAFLMMAAEIAILAKEYPSKTFAFLASFAAPVIIFGAGLNLNKALGRPITQTIAVKAGRMMAGVADFFVVPAFWYWHNSTCEHVGKQDY